MTALSCRESDYAPCCFSAFSILRNQCRDQFEFIERQLEMGLDAAVSISVPPLRHHEDVSIKEWREEPDGEPYPVLHKEYRTPAGTVHTAVNQSDDWPWGNHVPVMDDFLIPRSREFLVTPKDSLKALCYLLAPPTADDLAKFRETARRTKTWAAERGLLTVGYYGMVGDAACWLAGMKELMMLSVDNPRFVRRLLAVIEQWNRMRMMPVLEEGVDLFVRRGWYENADFWAPAQYREFILPSLQRDVELAHRAGAKFGYLISCASMPLLDMLIEAGVDVLMGVDPAQDRTMDLRELKARTVGKMCLWGGVCGYLTIECGMPEQVREQVRRSIATLAPGGGFILSPVTNIRADTERAWRNVETLIDTWRSLRGRPQERPDEPTSFAR